LNNCVAERYWAPQVRIVLPQATIQQIELSTDHMEDCMTNEHHRRRLLALEKDIAARIKREQQRGRDQFVDTAVDTGDASVADEVAAEEFSEAEMNATTLAQVREALGRIDAGTFGRCIVDGGPIEPARLEAVPWTAYCAKHQELLEEGSPRTSTL
jgi:DnaK suppressor protein